jgi:hypothetical protein
VPARIRDLGGHPVEEMALVERAREAVVQRSVVHLLLERLFQLVAVRELEDRRRPHLNLVAVVQLPADDAVLVDERAIGALEVLEPDLAAVLDHARVPPGYAVVVEPDVRVRCAADDRLGLVDAEHLAEASTRQDDEMSPVPAIRDLDGREVAYRGAILVAFVVFRVTGHRRSVMKLLILWSTSGAGPVKGLSTSFRPRGPSPFG